MSGDEIITVHPLSASSASSASSESNGPKALPIYLYFRDGRRLLQLLEKGSINQAGLYHYPLLGITNMLARVVMKRDEIWPPSESGPTDPRPLVFRQLLKHCYLALQVAVPEDLEDVADFEFKDHDHQTLEGGVRVPVMTWNEVDLKREGVRCLEWKSERREYLRLLDELDDVLLHLDLNGGFEPPLRAYSDLKVQPQLEGESLDLGGELVVMPKINLLAATLRWLCPTLFVAVAVSSLGVTAPLRDDVGRAVDAWLVTSFGLPIDEVNRYMALLLGGAQLGIDSLVSYDRYSRERFDMNTDFFGSVRVEFNLGSLLRWLDSARRNVTNSLLMILQLFCSFKQLAKNAGKLEDYGEDLLEASPRRDRSMADRFALAVLLQAKRLPPEKSCSQLSIETLISPFKHSFTVLSGLTRGACMGEVSVLIAVAIFSAYLADYDAMNAIASRSSFVQACFEICARPPRSSSQFSGVYLYGQFAALSVWGGLMLLSYTAQSPRETGKRVLKFTIPSLVALGLVSCAANWLCQSGLPMMGEFENLQDYTGTFPAAIYLMLFWKLIAFSAAVFQDPGGDRYPVCVTAVATLLAVFFRGCEWMHVCGTTIVSRLSKSNDSEGPVDTVDASTALLNRTPQREAPSVCRISRNFARYVPGLVLYMVVAIADVPLSLLCALKAAVVLRSDPVLHLKPKLLLHLEPNPLHKLREAVGCGSSRP